MKKSPIILALDVTPRKDLKNFIKSMVSLLEHHICAIKMNFHLLLPLCFSEITEINRLAHSYGLVSIADLKLNDIKSTNEIAIDYLSMMKFDAVIVNPFMGNDELRIASKLAHSINFGIIALVYMSHPGAEQGFGINVVDKKHLANSQNVTQMYKLFFDYASESNVDGIIIGATQDKIIKELSCLTRIPIYSPGIGKQGGEIAKAAKNGTKFFIVGRSIIESKDPLVVVQKIKQEISNNR
ncbi:MAG: orotidine 5'-phosphate decarboxylase [Thermoproteota archaeon]|nr:orotidine 5'-phosphate decarboxylase [Thermoproteota archaeon]